MSTAPDDNLDTPDEGRSPDERQPSADDSNPSGMAFWHSRIVRSMNAYLIAHPELDVQRWFEEQVSIRTQRESALRSRRMQRLWQHAGCITLLAGAIVGA